MKKILNSLILILFLILFLPQVKADQFFDIKNFHSDIQISENGSFIVEEKIDVYFYEERHGIFRDLDTQDINVRVKDVKDQNDEPWNYILEDFNLGTRIKIGDADKYISGDQTYKITYDVSRGIRFFDTHDELYWNVTGNYWPASIEKASATVHLPIGINPDKITATCYTGSYGSTEQGCTGVIYENRVEIESNRALNAYEGLTIVVGIPKNILTEPSSLKVMSNTDGSSVFLDGSESAMCETDCTIYLSAGTHQIQISKWGYESSDVIDIKLNSGKSKEILINIKQQWWRPVFLILILIILLLIAFEPLITFWRKGRDPEGRGTIIPEYEPPDKLIPVLMGSLVDERAHMRDITSTIIDLAVRGFLKIKRIPAKKWWILTTISEDYELIRQPVKENRLKRLSEFENELLKDIFGTKNSKKLSSLKNKFYKKLPDLKETVYKNLVDKEYFPAPPQEIRTKYFTRGILILSLGVGLLITEAIAIQSGFSVFVIINGILTLIFANFMPQKTENGMRAYEHILGFKLYIKTAEKDRIHFQEKEHLFYKFLPYAMTLGIAKKWSKAFGDIFKKPPDWYEGDEGEFHLPVFVSNLNSVSSQIKSTFASKPSSSGGGSGFSGGFSGGGFGGGGGGSW